MSGTIAAATDNGVGVAGVVPRAMIQPVRVLGTGGGGAGSDILAGIYWAAGVPVSGAPANATPAKVINMSLRGNSPGCPASYQQAINAANCENVVTVAAIGPQGYSTAYSNIGPRIDWRRRAVTPSIQGAASCRRSTRGRPDRPGPAMRRTRGLPWPRRTSAARSPFCSASSRT